MPNRRDRAEREWRCWDCGRTPAEQAALFGGNRQHLADCDPGECYCFDGDTEDGHYDALCEACDERQKWRLVTARLRAKVNDLEAAGLMMEAMLAYAQGQKPLRILSILRRAGGA